ncbi:MAG: LacI family DNA-binding transcriptional regulator [Roseitalea sp.]|jgi:LacI family transcriptional regulator|nr:LacI family DNA-binding transcriptional regulator [Roseitalea sp.]MBO6720333.1 LacI family DNA-binding transcriptional regulator [Roseitalea sp.]MBO6742693.1 LacI family DNA-binding transcriptional regulator [Roseitalea sp.]
MSSRVGLKQLAEQLGIDVSTVSRALRDDPRVKPETTASVRRLADALGYRPNSAARALRGGKTGRVAVLLSPPQQRFASPIFLELLATLDGHLRDQAMSLAVFAAQRRDEEPDIVRSIVEDRLADGIVLGRTLQDDARVRYLLDVGFPFVTFGRTSWQDRHSWVEIDYGTAGKLAVAALAESSPPTLDIVAAPEGLRFADNYVAGARGEAERRGIGHVNVTRAEMTEAQGELIAAGVLKRSGGGAVACIQDSLAFGLYRAAAKSGSVVGRDVAVFGGQNFPGSEHTAPPLSTFSTEDRRVADLLSRVMLNRLSADGNAAPEHHVIEPAPLLRASHLLQPTPQTGANAS